MDCNINAIVVRTFLFSRLSETPLVPSFFILRVFVNLTSMSAVFTLLDIPVFAFVTIHEVFLPFSLSIQLISLDFLMSIDCNLHL